MEECRQFRNVFTLVVVESEPRPGNEVVFRWQFAVQSFRWAHFTDLPASRLDCQSVVESPLQTQVSIMF